MINIEWYVYYYDVNRKKIDTYNIFEHGSFKKEFNVLLKCDLTKEVFADQLRHILMYYFWSKCEWETVLKPWVGDMNIGKKIDVYEQVMLNWDKFVEYAYNCKFKTCTDVIEYEKYKNIGTVEECEKAMKFAKHCQEENKYL